MRQNKFMLRRAALAAASALLCAGTVVTLSSSAGALTHVTLYVDGTAGTVTTGCTSSGAGACETIGEGVAAAEALSGDAITLDVAAGTYDESVTLNVPNSDTLTILGAGTSNTTLDDAGNGSDLIINTGVITVEGFSITGGEAVDGGGINNNNDGSSVTFSYDTIYGNTATEYGGDVYEDGADATFSDDGITGGDATAYGGDVYSAFSTATFTDDTIADDAAASDGGGVYVYSYYSPDSPDEFTDDTISGNTASYAGGGLNITNGALVDLTNVTIADNTADFGGGIYNTAESAVTLNDDTIAGNSAGAADGGGIYGYDSGNPSGGTIANSIVADNTGGDCGSDQSPLLTDDGYNVADDNTCDLGQHSLSSSSTIGPLSLGLNGSPYVSTDAITTTSSAFDEVPAADCTVSTDARGDSRPGGGSTSCDAGAFELQALTQSITFTSSVPPNATVGVSNYTPTATGGASGNPVVFSIGSGTTAGACSISNGVVSFTGAGTCVVAANQAAGGSYLAAPQVTQTFAVNQPTSPPPSAQHGYWLVGSDGGIFTFGSAQFYGSTGSLKLQRPVVGITPAKSSNGYWLVASDGGIFTFGGIQFYGSIPGLGLHPAGSGLAHSLNAPIVAMVPSYDDNGYFMVASDGGVFAFGDASFAGSCPGSGGCSGAAVAVAPDATGGGYWLVTKTGHVYTFGDAPYYGAPGPQSSSITSMVRTPNGNGYWILDANGQVFGYGNAANLGGPTGSVNGLNPATAIFSTADGGGYWVASATGGVYPYGDAPNDGGITSKLNGPIIAATGW